MVPRSVATRKNFVRRRGRLLLPWKCRVHKVGRAGNRPQSQSKALRTVMRHNLSLVRNEDAYGSFREHPLRRLALEPPQGQLDALDLPSLAHVAVEHRVEFPQISATTAIVEDGVDPLAVLAERGIGIDGHRSTSWGGLLRARLKQRRYTVAVHGIGAAGSGVVHLLGSVPFTGASLGTGQSLLAACGSSATGGRDPQPCGFRVDWRRTQSAW